MMTAARLPKLKMLSALIAITLMFSLALAEPAGRGSKSKKTSARASQKKGKSSRKAKVTARSRSSRSSKARARVSKKGSKSSKRRGVQARGRRVRSRYRAEPTTVTSYGHGTGVHRYLTDVWTKAQNPAQANSPDGSSAGAATPSMTESGNFAATIQPATPGMKPYVLLPSPFNPLVAAYSNSLAARGFSTENQGFIITTLKGEVLGEHNANRLYNPASVTKVATSLTAIARLGPDFKFRTSLYTDGALDPSTGILHGSLYVIGSGDPAFFYENAIMIADKLNRAGIREVEGNLVVLGQFYFGFSASRTVSARSFRSALMPETWNSAAKNAYPRYLSMRAAEERANNVAPEPWPASPPSLKIKGQTKTDPIVNTTSLKQLAVHTSLPLVHLLKGLNDFSNNWMAHVIGNLVGGPDAVERFLKTDVGFRDEEVSFATSSGLGANYISPRRTITLLRKLITYLDGKGLKIEDILPVAGIDAGTLQRRFTDMYRGSVVAKTGTLSGVSALAGVAYTRSRGPLLFVIYNRGGSVNAFRHAQDETLKRIINTFGGPAPVHTNTIYAPRVSQRSGEPSQESAGSAAPKQ